MTEQEIKIGIKTVCEISTEIASLYADNNALVAKLNSVPQDDLQKASDYYASRSGVIVDLRKDVLKYLKEGDVSSPYFRYNQKYKINSFLLV